MARTVKEFEKFSKKNALLLSLLGVFVVCGIFACTGEEKAFLTTPDQRAQLIADIDVLIPKAREVSPGAAVVLGTLKAALMVGEENDLAKHAAAFSERAIERLQKQQGKSGIAPNPL